MMYFEPSTLSYRNPTAEEQAKAQQEAAKKAVTTAASSAASIGLTAALSSGGAGASAAAAAGAAAGGSAAAGGGAAAAAGAAAAIPVVGWIALGVAAAAVGTVLIVRAVRKGKVRREDIIRIAKENGIPDVEDLPKFTVRAIKASPAKRARLGKKYQKAIERLTAKLEKARRARKQTRLGEKLDLMKSRLAILAVAEQLAAAEKAGKEPGADLAAMTALDPNPTLPLHSDVVLDEEGSFFTPGVILALGFGTLSIVGLVAFALRK